MALHIYHHHPKFKSADPLGGGLREEIAAEQNDDNVIILEDGLHEDALTAFWDHVQDDLHNDPTWFTFADSDQS